MNDKSRFLPIRKIICDFDTGLAKIEYLREDKVRMGHLLSINSASIIGNNDSFRFGLSNNYSLRYVWANQAQEQKKINLRCTHLICTDVILILYDLIKLPDSRKMFLRMKTNK